MADEIIIETRAPEVIEVGVPGPVGPAGTGLETLAAPGDTLYRGQTTGERLPIGSAGQVLKVVNGFPAWAPESGAVTSVNDKTGAVTLDAADVGAVSSSLFTATGDTLTRGANGSVSRVPIGSSGQVLTVQNSVPSWQNVPLPVATYLIQNTTVNGSSTGHGGAPGSNITSFTTPALAAVQVIVAQSGMNTDLTINLNTTSPQNGATVRVDVLNKSNNGAQFVKVIVSTNGFGNFNAYNGHSMFFIYSTNVFPNRWVRLVEPYNRAVPSSASAVGYPGEFAADARYIYFCTGVDQWRRVAIANW